VGRQDFRWVGGVHFIHTQSYDYGFVVNPRGTIFFNKTNNQIMGRNDFAEEGRPIIGTKAHRQSPRYRRSGGRVAKRAAFT
jgi:hypothetical protein